MIVTLRNGLRCLFAFVSSCEVQRFFFFRWPLKEVAQNLKSWHQTWLTETQPPPPDAEKKRVANRITTLLKRYDCES